jgi:hypothetical protein
MKKDEIQNESPVFTTTPSFPPFFGNQSFEYITLLLLLPTTFSSSLHCVLLCQ